jgi:hypothetical protein
MDGSAVKLFSLSQPLSLKARGLLLHTMFKGAPPCLAPQPPIFFSVQQGAEQ